MSQAVETPPKNAGRVDGESPPSGRNNSTSAILFGELVLARFRWFATHARYGELGGVPSWLAPSGWSSNSAPSESEKQRAERDYRELLSRFETLEGEIVAAYWPATVPSGLVMASRPPGWPRRVWSDPQVGLYRATEWLTASEPRVAELLHHCDTLGLKATRLLRGTPRGVMLTWIFSTESYLLGVVEGHARLNGQLATNGRAAGEAIDRSGAEVVEGPGPDQPAGADNGPRPRAIPLPPAAQAKDDAIARGRQEITEIETYFDRAASHAARFVYFCGMLVGGLLAAIAGGGIAMTVDWLFNVVDPPSPSTRFFFACYTAGALGAIVSVLTRMRRADRFDLDYDIGRLSAFWLGAFRPFLGAIFGLVVYFALQSELIQLETPTGGRAFFFVTLLAFAAGFSERLTHVLIREVETTVTSTGQREQGTRVVTDTVTSETPAGRDRLTAT